MMWYSLRHDNEFMYEMVICCNVKWPAHHGMMAGATRLLLLVSCVGIFPEEERRCSTVETTISLSENQGINPVGESRKVS